MIERVNTQSDLSCRSSKYGDLCEFFFKLFDVSFQILADFQIFGIVFFDLQFGALPSFVFGGTFSIGDNWSEGSLI